MSSRLSIRPALVAAAILLIVIAVQSPLIFFNPVPGRAAFSEGAFVEQLTVYFWIASAAGAVAAAFGTNRPRRIDFLLLGIVFLALAFRELDLNRHLYSWNLTRFVNYKKAYIPLHERLVAFGLILLPVGTALVALVVRNVKRLVAAAREREAWPLLVACWIALIVLTRIADKVAQSVHEERPHLVLMGIEESGECVVALYTVLIFLSMRRTRRSV